MRISIPIRRFISVNKISMFAQKGYVIIVINTGTCEKYVQFRGLTASRLGLAAGMCHRVLWQQNPLVVIS